jgi:hypothetical protein
VRAKLLGFNDVVVSVVSDVRGAGGDFVNLEDLPAQSFGDTYKGRVACVYS